MTKNTQITRRQIPIITAEQAEQMKTDIGLVLEFEPKEQEFQKYINGRIAKGTNSAREYSGHRLSDNGVSDDFDEGQEKEAFSASDIPESTLLKLRRKLGLASGRYGLIRSSHLVSQKHVDNTDVNPLVCRNYNGTDDIALNAHFLLSGEGRPVSLTPIQSYAGGFYNALEQFETYHELPRVKRAFFSSDQFRAIGENMDAVLEKIAKGNNPLIAKVIIDVTDVKANRQAMVVVYEALNHSLENRV